MSYSFTVSIDDKAKAKAMVTFEMAKVIAGQPPHCKDGPAVVKVAHAFIDAMGDEPTPVMLTVSGSVSTTNWQDGSAPLTHASVNLQVSRS